ncbi:protein kinase [Rhodotorula toruloides]
METAQAPFETPSKPPVSVDISTIEAAKENIVPLQSGRSASQLAALSSSTRSGLGVKLDAEHARFQAQIDAVEVYEQTGAWEDGKDGLSADDVALMAEDPLDISHQYVRFIVANYPAGASASNKLVPVLEATTRKFLGDGRYTNDPRYFRLWAHYAKNMENPEDCYRFLFAKGIGEKLAALYEEYAKVLEAKHKRQQADQVYNLGINRRATPLDRLKRSYLDFQARMLVAPPPPSPPRATSSSSTESRPILASSSTSRPAQGGIGIGAKGNGSSFAIFRDSSADENGAPKGGWEDLGTVKSRTRENNEEKKEWGGEVLPQKTGLAKPGGFKLEVYRDETASDGPSAHRLDETDVFSRSIRAPTEAELLRSNPFKNYSSSDADLVARDPLEGLQVLASSSSTAKMVKTSSSSAAGAKDPERKVRKEKVASPSSSASASSSTKIRSSSSSKSSSASIDPSAKPKERVACNLHAVYPKPGTEFSFEEIKAARRKKKYVVEDVERWNGWEWAEKWDEECQRTGRTTYVIDPATGWPVLHDQQTGAPLYDFLPRPAPPTPEPEPIPVAFVDAAPPSPSPASSFAQPATQRNLLSPSPPRQATQVAPPSPPRSSSPEPLDPNRPPSPTMNTKAANALLDHLFAKTLDFTKANRGSGGDGDSFDDTSTDDSYDDDAPFGGVPGGASQYSTQGATQQSDVSEAQFVPFSQTRSQMDNDSAYYGSQRPGPSSQVPSEPVQNRLITLDEVDEDAEIAPAPATSAPPPAQVQVFRDSSSAAIPATPGAGAFRPVTKTGSARVPLGMKVGTPLGQPPKQPAFSVLQDKPVQEMDEENVFGGDVVPSSQASESQLPLGSLEASEDSYLEPGDFEAPLRGSQEDGERFRSDGYDLGRRVPGQPSRYAPFVEQMTPIVERTLEFTAATSLASSQRSRRDSYYPTGAASATVREEDEDEDEPSTEEEDDEGDRAFMGSFAQPSFIQQPSQPVHDDFDQLGHDEDSTSDSSDSSSDSDSDDEQDLQPQPMLPPTSLPPQISFADYAAPSRSSLGQDTSYDVSPNTSLPEGLTITGNQSGMTTNMVVNDSTTTGRPQSPSADTTPTSSAAIDPYSASTLSTILRAANPPLLSRPGLYDHRSRVADRLAGLQLAAKKREKSKGGKDRTGTIDEAWDLELADETFSVREKLGEGSYGAVFRVAMGAGDDEDFDVDADDEVSLAVKVERPANLWEFYVLSQLHSRLPERIRSSVVSAQRLYAFQDESFLFLDYCDQGSLLDAVNRANDSGVAASATGGASQGLDEILAMFFVVELLRIVEAFHTAGFIHGDLKIDNCLLRLEEVPGGARAWSSSYDPSGANGWSSKGLKIIDYGRTIDTTAFPASQAFSTNIEADQFDCAEMREGRPWTFETDYFGVASIAYNALFGRYIETKRVPLDDAQSDGPSKWVLSHTWKRYYQVDLWTKLFDTLLNPRSVKPEGALPITEELAIVRAEMEEYLKVNGEKGGKSLRGMLKKLEIYSMSR